MITNMNRALRIHLAYDTADQFDDHFSNMDRLMRAMKAALAQFGGWAPLEGLPSNGLLCWHNKSLHVTVKRHDAPLRKTHFTNVLSNPLIAQKNAHVLDGLKTHQRALVIEVGLDTLDGMSSALMCAGLGPLLGVQRLEAAGFPETLAEFENRLILGQAVALSLMQEISPSTVHWVQSQQVFDAPSFVRIAKKGLCLALYIGANPADPTPHSGPFGDTLGAIRLTGSQDFLGRVAIMDAPDQHWADSYAQALSFISHFRNEGRVPKDGEAYRLGGAGARPIKVTYMPTTAKLTSDCIILTHEALRQSTFNWCPGLVRESAVPSRKQRLAKRQSVPASQTNAQVGCS